MRCLALAMAVLAIARPQSPPPAQTAKPSQTDQLIGQMTSRIAEEAEVFAHAAQSVLSEETLKQRTRKPASRFRSRTDQPKEQFVAREIVSEYGFSTLKDAPNALHEFRTVISVNGKKIQTSEKARKTLTMGVKSADDNLKKEILRDFEKHGLTGAATDFGQVILLFTKRRLHDYQFGIIGQERVGTTPAVAQLSRQKSASESLTTFAGRDALHSGLQGFLWLRTPDYLPLRIRLLSSRRDGSYVFYTDATVNYVMSPHGCVMPTAVDHRETIEPAEAAAQLASTKIVELLEKPMPGALLSENNFRYAAFKKFGSESELKFDAPIDPLPPPNQTH